MLTQALIVLLSAAPAGASEQTPQAEEPAAAVQPATEPLPPPPPPPVAAPVLLPPQAHLLPVAPEQGLLARRTLLEDAMPTVRRPVWMMIGSAGLGAASVALSVQFAQSGGFVALGQSPDPWMGVSTLIGIAAAAAGHALLGILGTVQMNKVIKERDAMEQQLASVDAELGRLPLPPAQLVPRL